MNIREMTLGDYEEVLNLWELCNIPLNQSDSKEQIEAYLKWNPHTSLVGVVNNKIIASVLGGYDGRRGIVNHLVVEEKYRCNGYGALMLNHLEKILTKKGVYKINFWVKKDNLQVLGFYKRLGYCVREDIITMSKTINNGGDENDENQL